VRDRDLRLSGTASVSEPRGRDVGEEQDRDVADRAAESGVRSACDVVCAAAGYQASITNLSRTSLSSDMVFSDGASLELATITGDVTPRMTAALTAAA
jgi:hypothetical protein